VLFIDSYNKTIRAEISYRFRNSSRLARVRVNDAIDGPFCWELVHW